MRAPDGPRHSRYSTPRTRRSGRRHAVTAPAPRSTANIANVVARTVQHTAARTSRQVSTQGPSFTTRAHVAQTPRRVVRQVVRDQVRQGQAEIRRALTAHPHKLPPFRLIDPLTSAGRPGSVVTRRGGPGHYGSPGHVPDPPNLIVTDKPSKPKPPHVIWDQASSSLFEYHAPKPKEVQHNVRKLFKGNPGAQAHALKQLQSMGVVTGGTPSRRYIKFLGHRTKTVGIIKNAQGQQQYVSALHKSKLPSDNGVAHYSGTTLSGKTFHAVGANGRPITMQRGPISGREIIHSLHAAFGTTPGQNNVQELGLLPFVKTLKHGILGGTGTALGVAGEALDRPLAASEAAIGKGLVAADLIRGDTARKIKHAPGPGQAFLHGRGREGVSGGDITQGLVGTRKAGILVDFTVDPLMWASLAALPETGGSSAAVIAERLGRLGLKDSLAAPRLAAMANHAAETKNFAEYEGALRNLAHEHGIKLPRNVLRTGWGQTILKDIRKRPTQQLLGDIKKMNPVEVLPKRGKVRRLLRRDTKPAQFHVIGQPGLDSVTSIARSVEATAHRPGFRLGVMTPLGRTHLPRALGGRQLPGVNVPLGKLAKIKGTGGFRGPKALKAYVAAEKARVDSKYLVRTEKELGPLQDAIKQAKLAKDTKLENSLTHDLGRKQAALNKERLVERDAVERKAKLANFGRTLHEVIDHKNAVRLQRHTSQFAQDYGRVVRARLDQAFAKAVSTEKLSPVAAQAARNRVRLAMWEREATGDNAILGPVLNLSPQEHRIEGNLRAVYDDALRQGQEIGVMGKGVPDYAGTRLWGEGTDPKNIHEVSAQVDAIAGIGKAGTAPGFTRHRTAASVFDLADQDKVTSALVKYAGVDHATAEHLAQTLWERGAGRMHAELAARKLQRGGEINFDALHPEQKRAVINATRFQRGGKDAPLLHVAEPGSELRSVTLDKHAEQRYGLAPAPWESLPEHQARGGKLLSAMQDRERVKAALQGTTGKRKEALTAELRDLNEQVTRLDAPVNTLPHDVQAEIATQTGAKALPADLKQSTVINDSGVLWVTGAERHVPPGLPPERPNEAGLLEDPLDYAGRLPDWREKDAMPVIDPFVSAYYSNRAQGRLSAYKARWGAIDSALGRTISEARDGRVVLPDGSQTTQDALKATAHDAAGNPTHYTDHATGIEHAAADMFFPERTLLPRDAKPGHPPTIWHDPRTGTEYKRPNLGGAGTPLGVAPDRVWPTQTIRDAEQEIARDGGYDAIVRAGLETGYERFMGAIRYGVTTPFPAYHIRNLISDALKSLQADPGVIFHPVVNAKLLLAAGAPQKAAALTIKIPGHGAISAQDFLLLADITGVRSGHHVAEVYQLFSSPALSESAVRRGLQRINKLNPLAPNSYFGHAFTAAGVRREDIIRFQTFIQRMRRNGGDAADAAMYMIRHHFNYNDLSATERRFARNVFLFYTWYRKNVPLQLAELVRRPGFFAGVAHAYRALEMGETPLNQDWSQIAGWLPNMEGRMPQSAAIPDYYRDRLLAAGTNWNGHAVMFGFGAPWADLQLLSEDGGRDTLAMTNPVIGDLYQLFSGKEVLTGRQFKEKETSGIANIAQALGFDLPKDASGKPILPYWVNVLGNSVPILGRGGSATIGPSPYRDTGRLSQISKYGLPLFGINAYVGPTPGSKHEIEAISGLIRGRAAEAGLLSQRLGNLPKQERTRRLNEFKKETAQWAKDHHIPRKLLEQVPRSQFYVPPPRAKAGPGLDLGGSSSSKGLHLGGSGGSSAPSFGGGNTSGADYQVTGSATPGQTQSIEAKLPASAKSHKAKTSAPKAVRLPAVKQRTFAHPQRTGNALLAAVNTVGAAARAGAVSPAEQKAAGVPASSKLLGKLASKMKAAGYSKQQIALATKQGKHVKALGHPAHSEKGIVAAAAKRWGVDPHILWGQYGVETGFGTNVANSGSGPNGGAKGPFQFEDATAASYGVNVKSFKSSAEGAAHYMHDLIKQHHGDVAAALNSYSGGAAGYAQGVAEHGKQFDKAGSHTPMHFAPGFNLPSGGSVPISSGGGGSVPSAAPSSSGVTTDTQGNLTVKAGKGGLTLSTADTTAIDEDSALIDALIAHKGGSLLQGILARLDGANGNYTPHSSRKLPPVKLSV